MCVSVCVCVGGGGQVLISLFMHELAMASTLLDDCSHFKSNGKLHQCLLQYVFIF